MAKLEVVIEVTYQKGGETKTFYQRVGSAVPDKNGEGGMTIYLNSLPMNGKLWVRPIREDAQRQAPQGQGGHR